MGQVQVETGLNLLTFGVSVTGLVCPDDAALLSS